MSDLVVKPNQSSSQKHHVTPETAGWKYVGFDVHTLKENESFQSASNSQEVCIVVLSGKLDVITKEERFENIGERMDVFDKLPPYSVYVPAQDDFHITARTEAEVALCKAPATGKKPARLISPNDIGQEDRGTGSMSRKIHNILPETEEAESLLVVEVFTPAGNWSSYPPHKHDTDNLPEESYLEETYYHKIDPPEQGFVIQRVYNDNRSLNELMEVRHNNVVVVPEGYHPVSAPPGYQGYYLNVMAGPRRTWKFQNDPDHEWLMK